LANNARAISRTTKADDARTASQSIRSVTCLNHYVVLGDGPPAGIADLSEISRKRI
jgi:hypothetical protein